MKEVFGRDFQIDWNLWCLLGVGFNHLPRLAHLYFLSFRWVFFGLLGAHFISTMRGSWILLRFPWFFVPTFLATEDTCLDLSCTFRWCRSSMALFYASWLFDATIYTFLQAACSNLIRAIFAHVVGDWWFINLGRYV